MFRTDEKCLKEPWSIFNIQRDLKEPLWQSLNFEHRPPNTALWLYFDIESFQPGFSDVKCVFLEYFLVKAKGKDFFNWFELIDINAVEVLLLKVILKIIF